MTDKLADEAIRFFRSHPVYRQVCETAARKYYGLGKITGSIGLQRFSEDDYEALAGFIGISPFDLSKKKSLSFSKWLQAYQKSRFAAVPFEAVVVGVTGRELVSKAEKEGQLESEQEDFCSQIREDFPYLRFVLRERDWLFLFQAFQLGTLGNEELGLLNACIGGLPGEDNPVRLPVFAQKMSGNPHRLDSQTALGGIFYRLLVLFSRLEWEAQLSETERKNQVYLNNGLIRDDILNFVTVNGMRAEAKGERHPMWEASVAHQVTWNVPLKHLLELDKIYPSEGKAVWAIENSSVFSAIQDSFPGLPLICTQGQFTFAVWKLLEKLPEDCRIFYAGDFDPEGLQIADKLVSRYPQKVMLFCMDEAHYLKAIPETVIGPESMKRLANIRSGQLESAKNRMEKLGKAAYQENLLDAMFEKIGAYFAPSDTDVKNT